MSSELTMMEAALFQLRAALGSDPAASAINVAASLVANAVAAARQEGVNAARVNDIEFAMNDLVAAIDDAGAPDGVYAAVAMLQDDVAQLRAATAIAPEVITGIRDLQAKLRVRKSAIERNQYRAEGAPDAALPHDPEELRMSAIPLARQLAAAGFDTPALDVLVAEPEALRYHSIVEIIDELDVIAGG